MPTGNPTSSIALSACPTPPSHHPTLCREDFGTTVLSLHSWPHAGALPIPPATTAAVPKPSYIPQAPSAGPLQALLKQAICLSLGPEPPSSHTPAPAEGERGAVMSDGLGWCRGRCRGAVGLKHTRQSSPCERTCPHHIPWCPLTFLVTSWKGLCAAHCALRGPPTTPYSARH